MGAAQASGAVRPGMEIKKEKQSERRAGYLQGTGEFFARDAAQ